jgi:hypothetical protein
MKARHLIEGSTYGPEALTVLSQAFDEAWALIAPKFGDDPAQQEAARLRLAHAVLAVAPEEGIAAGEVREAALKVMALRYPSHFPAPGSGST